MGIIRGSKLDRVERLDPAVVEILREKTSAERVAMVFDAERMMRQLLRASIGTSHPDWDQQQVEREIARRWLRGTG